MIPQYDREQVAKPFIVWRFDGHYWSPAGFNTPDMAALAASRNPDSISTCHYSLTPVPSGEVVLGTIHGPYFMDEDGHFLRMRLP